MEDLKKGERTSTMMDHAMAYARGGIPVFPVKPRAKLPLTVRGFKDATVDMATIKSWWTRWPDANIGVPTGAASGWAVVDIDIKKDGSKRGDLSLEYLVDENGPIPDTLESITGSGGRHLIFQYGEGFRNSASAIGKDIDTRGEGGYIVVPPSLHETGQNYEWEGGEGPDIRNPAPLPPWLDPHNAKPLVRPEGNLDFRTTQLKASGQPVSPGSRNMSAASLAGQYLQAGDSVQSVLTKLKLWNINNPQPLPDREIETVAASVALTHQRNNPSASVSLVDILAIESTAEPMDIDLKKIDFKPKDPIPFPADLLDPPGFIGEMCRWVNKTAYMPQPILTVANVLAFFGAVVGRKVQNLGGLRTNLYCMGVGASGCGKDHSRQQIKAICDAAGLTESVLGGEDISSDSAILGAVYERPSILFQWDEIGHLISNATSRYAQSHQRAIAPTLTKLFSSARSKMLGKEYAGRKDPRKDIDQPNVCLYGTTVPGRLFEGLTPAEISDGFLGRMLVFQSDNSEPAEQDVEAEDVPESITNMVRAWFDFKPPAVGVGNIERATKLSPLKVHSEADATAEFRRFRERCKQYKADTRSLGLDPLWSRAVEHANKVALTIACGESFQTPIISGQTAAWSIKLVEHLIHALIETVKDSVAGSDFEKEVLYVFRVIKEAGEEGVSQSQLLQRTRRINPKARQDILNHLMGANNVIKTERKSKSGPAAIVFRASNEKENNC